MEVNTVESRIKKLKGKIAKTKKEERASASNGADGLRETRKKLKRAQRRRKVLLTQAAFIQTKSQKKVKKGAEAESQTGPK